jgi:hypothetical protein
MVFFLNRPLSGSVQLMVFVSCCACAISLMARFNGLLTLALELRVQKERANAAKETSTSAEFSAWPRTAEEQPQQPEPEQAPQFAAQVQP